MSITRYRLRPSIGCGNQNHRQQRDIHRLVAGKLLQNNILVVGNGCAADVLAKGPDIGSSDQVGSDLRSACEALGIPPILAMGNCADGSRLLSLAGALLEAGLGEDFPDLPVAVTAPTWISERIATTGQCLVASGINAFFPQLPVTGSKRLSGYLQNGCREEYGASWRIEEDPEIMADKIIALIGEKRQQLGKHTASLACLEQ